MIKFNVDEMIRQSFPFPDPIMDYIFKNAEPQHLIKLYQCSKWFYFKYGQNFIQHLEIVDDGEPESFDLIKTVVCGSNPVLKELADFYITDSFIDRAHTGFFPTFSHCTIKKLELCSFIYWEDFELLTKAGNIEELKIFGVIGEMGDVSVDAIIAKVPNATSIEIAETQFSPKTCASLVLLDHQVKITNLVLKNFSSLRFFERNLFIDFVLKNSDNHCNVHVDFKVVPEVDDASRDLNATQLKLGNILRELIAEK